MLIGQGGQAVVEYFDFITMQPRMSGNTRFRFKSRFVHIFLMSGKLAQSISRGVACNRQQPGDRTSKSWIVKMALHVEFQKNIMDDVLGLNTIHQLLNEHGKDQRRMPIVKQAQRFLIPAAHQVNQLGVAQANWQ